MFFLTKNHTRPVREPLQSVLHPFGLFVQFFFVSVEGVGVRSNVPLVRGLPADEFVPTNEGVGDCLEKKPKFQYYASQINNL